MHRSRLVILTTALLAAVPVAAHADATLFIGTSPTPANRAIKGAAVGMSLLFVGFEFEYASASEDVAEAAPGLTTAMGNLLVQPPVPIAGFQPYVTAGVGGYSERLDAHHSLHLGVNAGGGVKVSLVGPLRVRLDYRVMQLAGDPLHARTRRIYAGVHLAF